MAVEKVQTRVESDRRNPGLQPAIVVGCPVRPPGRIAVKTAVDPFTLGYLKLRYPTTMHVGHILAELRQEHHQITEAILSLERLTVGQKRRGRPPKWIVAATHEAPPRKRGRPPGVETTSKE